MVDDVIPGRGAIWVNIAVCLLGSLVSSVISILVEPSDEFVGNITKSASTNKCHDSNQDGKGEDLNGLDVIQSNTALTLCLEANHSLVHFGPNFISSDKSKDGHGETPNREKNKSNELEHS